MRMIETDEGFECFGYLGDAIISRRYIGEWSKRAVRNDFRLLLNASKDRIGGDKDENNN